MPLVSKPFGDIVTFTRASSATFTGSDGLIQTAAINAPRFDYDPVTLAAKGLLIEEQRTNLLTYSEAAASGPWILTNITASVDTTVAPDGTTTADTITEGTGAQIQFANAQSRTITSGQTITLSRYVKRGAGALRGFRLECDGSTDGFRANFDPDTGAVSSSSAFGAGVVLSAGSEPAANGFRRYYVTGTAGTVTSINAYFRFTSTPTGSTIGYTGDGIQSFVVWGAQLEAGSFATSYIPTVASQVTRSADVASVNTLSPWFNASEGTLYAEWNFAGYSSFNPVIDIGTDQNNIMTVSINSVVVPRFTVVSGGVTQANLTLGSAASPNTTYKQVGAYKENDFAACLNGGTVATDTSGTVPAATQATLGGTIALTRALNGHIRRITYYPRRLSNAELQAITA